MTIPELNIIAKDLQVKLAAAKTAVESALSMVTTVVDITEPNKPISNALTQLVGADVIAVNFFPDYLTTLTSLEVATDALGTDALNGNAPPAIPQ